MGRATKQRGDQDGQRDGKRDDKNTSTRMTRTKAVVTLAVLFLLASAAGTPTFAAEDVEVKNNDALAALAQQMISADGVLENFTISITGGVTDLTPLSGLKHIKNGGLEVTNTMNLVSLAPLENLEVVDQTLEIGAFSSGGSNEALTDIALPALTEVGGTLEIYYNDALTNISLPSLTQVGRTLGIYYNDALTDISLPSLTEVGGYLAISYNDALAGISLPSLTEVGKELGIGTNAALTGISLPLLTQVGGHLAISYNDALTAISLPSLTEIGGYLEIDQNAALADLALPSLTEVGGSVKGFFLLGASSPGSPGWLGRKLLRSGGRVLQTAPLSFAPEDRFNPCACGPCENKSDEAGDNDDADGAGFEYADDDGDSFAEGNTDGGPDLDSVGMGGNSSSICYTVGPCTSGGINSERYPGSRYFYCDEPSRIKSQQVFGE